jgi:hypothetical protein
MRFFAGLEVEEIGACLDISPATVKRDLAVRPRLAARGARRTSRRRFPARAQPRSRELKQRLR